MRHKNRQGLIPIPPVEHHLRIAEQVNPWWLGATAGIGVGFILFAILLDLVWDVRNIVPSVCLEIGAGALLFSLLFFLERRIVRRTSLVFVSALEELAAQMGRDPREVQAHFQGPVAVVNDFVDAILTDGDYSAAWRLADDNWRLCRAQAWLWSNRTHSDVASFDRDEAADALAQLDSDHPLWESFASTELNQMTEVWSEPDLREYGAASAKRKVGDDCEIVLLVDLSEHPHGAMVQEPTLIQGVPFLVRQFNGQWLIVNLVGDHFPVPGWPPNWNEGWTYWDQFREKLK